MQMEHSFFDNGAIVANDDLIARFQQGLANVAAVSLAIGYPTEASAPHLVANAFKQLLAIAAETDVTFKEADKLKEYLADSSKFTAPTKAVPAPAIASKEEESDEDMGFGLFD